MTTTKYPGLALLAIVLAATLIFGFAGTAVAVSKSASATLSGSNEVPPVTSSTTGSLSLTYDSSTASSGTSTSSTSSVSNMQFALSVSGDGITMAHLHCAPTGVNGPPVVTLYVSPQESGTSTATTTGISSSGLLASNSITNSKIQSADCASKIGYNIMNLEGLTQAIASGQIYANVHSVQFPDGAARGQLVSSATGTSTATTTPPTTGTTTPPTTGTTTPPTSTTTPPTTGTTTPPITPTTTPPVVIPTTTPPVVMPPPDHLQVLSELRDLLAQITVLLRDLRTIGWNGDWNWNWNNNSTSSASVNGGARAQAGDASASVSESGARAQAGDARASTY